MNSKPKVTNLEIADLAKNNGFIYPMIKAIIEVESNGFGFSPETGKIIIQFEPSWFKRKAPVQYQRYLQFKNQSASDWRQKRWDIILDNKVSNQRQEWIAFDAAFSINKDAAMQSTSIGLMQVMGFHYSELGFKEVGDMWDYAKKSEKNQVDLAIRFIKQNPKLNTAVATRDFASIAYYYNGANYRENKYDARLMNAYKKYTLVGVVTNN
jgi:hypothetical protein